MEGVFAFNPNKVRSLETIVPQNVFMGYGYKILDNFQQMTDISSVA